MDIELNATETGNSFIDMIHSLREINTSALSTLQTYGISKSKINPNAIFKCNANNLLVIILYFFYIIIFLFFELFKIPFVHLACVKFVTSHSNLQSVRKKPQFW